MRTYMVSSVPKLPKSKVPKKGLYRKTKTRTLADGQYLKDAQMRNTRGQIAYNSYALSIYYKLAGDPPHTWAIDVICK